MTLANFTLSRGLYWLATVTSLVALLIVFSNIAMLEQNRKANQEIAKRGQQIQQNVTFSNLNQSLIQALAQAAVEKKDEQILALLANNGIKIEQNAEAAAPAAPAPEAPPQAPPAEAPRQ